MVKVARAIAMAGVFALGSAEAHAATLTFDTVQFPGTGVPLSVTGSDGTVFTFSAGPSSQFESFASGGGGSFPAGTFFLAPGLGNTTPINIAFSAPVTSFTVPVSSDRVGDTQYTSTVSFFNNGLLINAISGSGNTQYPASTFSANGLYTSASISTQVPAQYAAFGYTQNIGPITYQTVLGTPGPIAGAGLVPLFGLAGAYLFGRRRKVLAA